jgi:hypothetical protein
MAESHTTQGLDISDKMPDNSVDISDKIPDKQPNLDVSHITQTLDSQQSQPLPLTDSYFQQGGGVNDSCKQVVNITVSDVISQEIEVETTIPIEDLQPGDIVESEKLPLGLRGWGKVASICDDQVFVELAAKAIPIDSITFIRREK